MSAEIIQFVPKPNPKRQEAELRVAEAFNSLVGVWPDFSSRMIQSDREQAALVCDHPTGEGAA